MAPVDFDPGHVVYVWVDALFNYTTALGFMNDRYHDYDKYWPADVHFVGKEIVRFHSIIWPAMLMSMDMPLPKHVYGHGWLVMDGGKMSKSKGNVVDPYVLAEKFGVDALRFFLLRTFPFGSDGNFSNELLIQTINMDLANDLGNLVSRTTAMVEKYFGGTLPAERESSDADCDLKTMASTLRDRYETEMEHFQFQNALEPDMIVKGVKGFDYERAYEAMKTTALNEHYDCLPDYMRNGYVPFDKEAESVSKTLEYAYDDYCIAQAAKALGKMDDYQYFLNRSLSYQTLIDPETKYMRGRDSQGNWRTPFTPVAYQGPGSVNGWGDITEGFTMQYTWTVPHDVQGYINLAGKKLFEKRLDDLFTVELPDDIPGAHDIQGRIGGYWHGNEPCHHIAYLYNYLGKPWKCQKWIREIVARFYGNEPGSLSGNDDCGQMSAWYMFNCAGFYPVAPSSNIYNIGSPCVEALSIRMSNGKEIKMTTENWSEENVYIKELYVNGKKYDKSYLTYEDVQAGITLHFVMSGKPNYKRAVSADARPASLSSPGKTMFYQISDSK